MPVVPKAGPKPKPNKVTGKNLNWPLATPTWVRTTLVTEASANQLYGIPPQVLAALSLSQHEYGTTGQTTGLGTGGPNWINSTGYGGYFGLGATKPYPAGTATRIELETASLQSFREQAHISASDIAEYLKLNTGTFIRTFNVLTTGKPTGLSESADKLKTTVFQGHIGTYMAATGQIKTAQATANQPTVRLPGVGGILQELTKFLHPSVGGVAGSIETTIATIAARGILGSLFLGMALIGVYVLAKGSAPSTIRLVQSQQRIRAGRERTQASTQRAQLAAQPRTTYRYSTSQSLNMRLGYSVVTHRRRP